MVKTKEDKAKAKIMEALHTQEGWEEFEDMLSDISVKCEVQPLDIPEDEPRLKTNTILDDILGGGGLTAGKTVELYGEYASGKTQILFTLAVEAASEGLVVFIDVEDTFSRTRISQIAKERGKDVEKINNNILLFTPNTWLEQLAIPTQLPDPLPVPLKFIAVDSLMALFRSTPEFAGRSRLGKRQELIRFHLRQLKNLVKEYGGIVAYSNQIYDKPVANPFLPDWASQVAAGGHSVWHIGDFRIFLRKGPKNVRIARLVDNAELPPSERVFQINEKGVDDLSDEQQKAAKKRLEKWEKTQQSGEFVKKRKKDKTSDEMAEEALKSSKDVENEE